MLAEEVRSLVYVPSLEQELRGQMEAQSEIKLRVRLGSTSLHQLIDDDDDDCMHECVCTMPTTAVGLRIERQSADKVAVLKIRIIDHLMSGMAGQCR